MEALKFEFVKDKSNLKLKEVLANNIKLKEIHIDIYPSNPMKLATFMLLLRISENNVIVSNDGNRLILKKNNIYKTHFLNILLSEIKECYFNRCNNHIEFIINVQNIYYRIIIIN